MGSDRNRTDAVRAIPIWQISGFPDGHGFDESRLAPLGYFFSDAPEVPTGADRSSALEALADAAATSSVNLARRERVSSVVQCFGRFVIHDISAIVSRAPAGANFGGLEGPPLPRDLVTGALGNLRAGAIGLASIYGGGPQHGPISQRFGELLRCTQDCAKLWVGAQICAKPGHKGEQRDERANPRTCVCDALRLGHLLDRADPQVSEAELESLLSPVRRTFAHLGGSPEPRATITSPASINQNATLARLHRGLLRTHNAAVTRAHDLTFEARARMSEFDWARRRVTWHFQWLVLNEYLPAVCDPNVVSDVLAGEAPLYKGFLDRAGRCSGGTMPIPLEFFVIVSRLRRNFWADQPVETLDGQQEGLASADAVAFAESSPQTLGDAHSTIASRHLGRRSLLLEHRLNIPSAQGCLLEMGRMEGMPFPQLSPTQLGLASTGLDVHSGGLYEATPLWFYISREAEVLGCDGRLGPLGSRLLAETLAGIVIHDPSSYWSSANTTGLAARWRPDVGLWRGEEAITSIDELIEAPGDACATGIVRQYDAGDASN